ncbi:MAG: protein-glutamate O-methyltransferase family protein [Anaerolineaceae bacterium]|nr:protein-glutamate O-methyltransferase family protein [Anaerolineaceae bacterium]
MIHNSYSLRIKTAIEEFIDEIRSGTIEFIKEDAADRDLWNREIAQYQGLHWLELPWFFAEVYFYRRLLEITGYYQPDSPDYNADPFDPQKQLQMLKDMPSLESVAGLFDPGKPTDDFPRLLRASLWGNRADLSNITVDVRHAHDELENGHHLRALIDDTQQIQAKLMDGVNRIDYFTDNVGREFIFDLVLIDFLLEHKWANEILIKAKPTPFFVSDVMPKDIDFALNCFSSHSREDVRNFAKRINEYIDTGCLKVRSEEQLSYPFFFSEMPQEFIQSVSEADLVIFKGDVNYRRVVGDRHWPHDADTTEIAAYFPVPLLMVRTIKAELMTGLARGEAEVIQQEFSNWLISGDFGLIQYLPK